MRFAVGLFLVLALSSFGRTLGLERLAISGSEYVRLGEWCDGNGFHIKWNRKAGDIELTDGAAVLGLTVDSRKAEISGTTVWLSLPVINRNGVALISLVDLRSTIDPVLFPRKSSERVSRICIDPGHGGKDTGKAVGENYEKKYTLLLAREVAQLLKEDGFKVVLTRDRDETVELGERAQIAAQHDADLFISLHYNAAPQSDVRGLEVYCLAPPGMNASNEGGGKSSIAAEAGNAQDERNILLAFEMQKTITRAVALEDRGLKRSHFKVLAEAKMPAILIEGGYMTNPLDAKNIYDSNFRRRMARAIVDGVLAYRRQTERTAAER